MFEHMATSEFAAQADAFPARPVTPATEAQVNFIAKLVGERNLEGYDKAEAVNRVASGTLTIPKSSASAAISELLALPKLEDKTAPAPAESADVPEGRYAVEVDGTLKFYKVDRPTEGQWKGYTFVKVQASDDLHPIRNRTAREAVLRAIADAGLREAMLRYGIELGSCGHCGRTLTNEESRARGIGPVCADKMGW